MEPWGRTTPKVSCPGGEAALNGGDPAAAPKTVCPPPRLLHCRGGARGAGGTNGGVKTSLLFYF